MTTNPNSQKQLEYQVKKEDLERCFKFALDYHLDSSKNSSNRTTGQYRGLGGIIDSFFIGKLIEIGVAKIIEKLTSKQMILDFEIHGLTKENISDPDIVTVLENGKKRMPQTFVEIKNVSPADRWVGLTAEQFSTILRSKIVSNHPEKIFIVCASLIPKNTEKDSDPLGVYLKTKIENRELSGFADFGDLFVTIQYIYTGQELQDKGVAFDQGSYLYETEVFQEVNQKTVEKILSPLKRDIYKQTKCDGQILPVIMRDSYPVPEQFGAFEFSGCVDIYTKKNPKSNRMYLHCKTDVEVKNKVLGVFNLKKGKTYDCFFATVGSNPSLKRNNVWIARRNLPNIVTSNAESRIKEIAKSI